MTKTYWICMVLFIGCVVGGLVFLDWRCSSMPMVEETGTSGIQECSDERDRQAKRAQRLEDLLFECLKLKGAR